MIINGEVKHLYYQSDSFTVARLKTSPGGEYIKILGEMPGIAVGCQIKITSYKIEDSEKYGRQYRVCEWYMHVPSSKEGVVAFLESGLVRGVGPKIARQIVDTLGVDAIEIIVEGGVSSLIGVAGVGKKRAKKIHDSVTKHYALQGVMQELMPLGLTSNIIMRAYRQFGPDVAKRIKHNPYCLSEVWGMGFLLADAVAQRLGVKHDAFIRIGAATKYILLQATEREGHCFLPQNELLCRLHKLLGQTVAPGMMAAALHDMRQRDHSVVFDDDRGVYLSWLQDAEDSAAAAINMLFERCPAQEEQEEVDIAISDYCKHTRLFLSGEQRDAIRLCFSNSIAILTGGPGTGKTQTIKAICDIANNLGYGKIALCAPTGRASRVLSAATSRDASTVHRLIELLPCEKPLHNAEAPLPHDLVIVDEASMLDINLASYLFRAIKPGGRLLLVGDKHQLPAVGPGNVFTDLLLAGLPAVNLTKIYRQAVGSTIAENAHAVNAGSVPRFEDADDFYYIFRDEPAGIAKMVTRSYLRLLEKNYAVGDIQVLSPMKKGEAGVINLNKILQDAVNPARWDKAEISVGNTTFRVGDKVMQIRNNYDKQVFNGELGIIKSIGPAYDVDGDELDSDVVYVAYANSGDAVTYRRHELEELALAYAVTIHKAQGSEYPAVILAFSMAHYVMLQRCVLYTAISRAKEFFVFVGSKKALTTAVKNQRIDERYTALSEKVELPAIEGSKGNKDVATVKYAKQLFDVVAEFDFDMSMSYEECELN